MARPLIILMLMATHLLAGSGVSLYICVANDGSYCCVDTGSAACSCCDVHQETSDDACCSDPACEAEVDAALSGMHDAPASPPQQPKLLTDDPCGCTHIPVVVSSDQPTFNSRSSKSAVAEQLSHQFAMLLAPFNRIESAAPSLPLRWNENAAIPDFALTVVSTVVIRC